MSAAPKPMLLLILDGWGYSENPEHNAILAAKTPNWDKLWANNPKTLISGSGLDVGLPSGQMGNSEVGHLNLGAGRVVYQDYTRITKSIDDQSYFDNPAITGAIDSAIDSDAAVHIMGLLSPGGVHSHEEHIFSTIKLAAQRGAKKVYLHAFLDGRDMPPRSAESSLLKAKQCAAKYGVGRIASMTGRYYAMDRDQRWDRVEAAYNMLVNGVAEYHFDDPVAALEAAYERGENDEFVKTSTIGEKVSISDQDTVIFMNYRADRARQLTRSFVDQDFSGFQRQSIPQLNQFVMLTQYAADIQTIAAFPPLHHSNVLGDYLAQQGKTQLRIAETEKYAHVTFFFNGGIEQPFEGETRRLIPSPNVATYDLQPEMNAPLMSNELATAIREQKHDVIIGNFANPDMVGHTGNFAATVKAIETIDVCLGQIVEALEDVNGEALITADHGNAEKMADHETGQAHTAHTSGPVPLVYVGRDATVNITDGVLADIAPTLLTLMGLAVPEEMTGRVIMTASAE